MFTDSQMDKENVVYTYNGILFSHKKKKKILSFITIWMDLNGLMFNEIRQKKTNSAYHLYVEFFKKLNSKRTN